MEMTLVLTCCLLGIYFPIYPLWLWWRGKTKEREDWKGELPESLSVILPVHNEALYLAEKLENILGLERGGMKMEVVIAMDGCTDDTTALMSAWQNHPLIKTTVLPQRAGKVAAINAAVAIATGEVLLFCDASQRIASDALLHLLAPFRDTQTGLVSGCLEHEGSSGSGWKLIRKYTNWLRGLESGAGWLVGAYGPLYAVRRSLFEPLPENVVLDDMLLPMLTAEQGRRARFEARAKVFDRREFNGKAQFGRMNRIVGGLIQCTPFIFSAKMPRVFKAMFFFHKLYRLLLMLLGGAGLAFLILSQSQGALWMTFVLMLGFLFASGVRCWILQFAAAAYSLLTAPFLKPDVRWKK